MSTSSECNITNFAINRCQSNILTHLQQPQSMSDIGFLPHIWIFVFTTCVIRIQQNSNKL